MEQYLNEFDEVRSELDILPGLYSDLDTKILYATVRDMKPLVVVDCGPREGRTTSTIIQALVKNQMPVDYYLFEKDKPYFDSISSYCNRFQGINFHIHENILDYDFSNIGDIDLLFIDANHDYIISRWYMDALFPLVSEEGVIHIHDLYYNKNGNGWLDTTLAYEKQDHPDIMDPEVLKRLYGTYYYKYCDMSDVITKYEGDIVAEFIIKNPDIRFVSTLEIERQFGIKSSFPSCSVYFYPKRKL